MKSLESYLSGPTDIVPASGSAISLRDLAYERIKLAIRQGALQPGEPISETRLSRLLGISRTPVREALQTLAQEGLVQIIPGRAVMVAAPTIDDTLNAIQVRLIVEPEVVKMATDAISAADLERLWAAMQRMEEAVSNGDRATWSEADTIFHEVISAACPNRLLGDLALQFRHRVSFVAVDAKTAPDRLANCTAEHRIILERMTERDAAGAREAMSDHIHKLWESIVRRFSRT